MAYRYGERRQGVLFPVSIEDYVSADSPVRAYDAISRRLHPLVRRRLIPVRAQEQ